MSTDTNADETGANWSVPETEVLATARDHLEAGRRAVLATVIAVEGSAYRRPGAKMLLTEDGDGVGHITAGCLEDDVQQLASAVLEAGEPRVERYDLMPEADEDVWGLGVGCNGVIDILLEPLEESYRPAVDAFDAGEDVGVVTVVDGDGEGSRAYYDPATDTIDGVERFPAALTSDERLREIVAGLTARGRADTVEVGDRTVFVDGLDAPDDLVVVGTGHDVGPIAALGKQAEFRVTVVGFRGAAAKADRFPAAHDVVSTSPTRMSEAYAFDEDTYVVVATHNFVDDRLAVDELLQSPVPYIGLMGPRERFEEMREAFAEEGREFTDAELGRLYTPVGLDLGGGSPHQIAISIVGEALAVANGREPRHLRERAGPIHDRIDSVADGA